MNYKVMTDTLKDSSMLGSTHHVMEAHLKISLLSKLSWKSVNIIFLHICLVNICFVMSFQKK